MLFILGYDRKAYLFSDTRVSVSLNGQHYYSHDGVQKAKVFGNKIIFAGGHLDAIYSMFDNLDNRDLDITDVQRAARQAHKSYSHGKNCLEMGVYVLSANADGRYIMHTIGSDSNFKIESDYIKDRDIFGAGANRDKALDYINRHIGSANPLEIIRNSYNHVADEKVGGTCVIFELAFESNSIKIKKYESLIVDTKPLKRLPRHATMDGNIIAKKAKLIGAAGQILFDTQTGKIDFGSMDIQGVGALQAQFIQAGTATIDDGFINNLTVTALKTLDKSDTIGGSVDYVHARDNYIKLITGTITDRSHTQNAEGDYLYWTDADKTQLTTDVTAYPFYQLTYNPIEKFSLFLEGEGMASYPKSIWGTGDGVTPLSGKGMIEKPVGSLDITYYRSNTGAVRAIRLDNVGITIRAESNGSVTIEGSDININASNGITFNANSYNFA